MLHPVHPCSILHQIGCPETWNFGSLTNSDVKTCLLQVMPLISNDFNDETARSSKRRFEAVRRFSKRQTCMAFFSKFSSNRILRCPARRWRRIWSSGRPEVQWTTWIGSSWSSHSASWRSPRSCIDECDSGIWRCHCIAMWQVTKSNHHVMLKGL